jgi:hypothetical protein
MGMIRLCFFPASDRSWPGRPKTRRHTCRTAPMPHGVRSLWVSSDRFAVVAQCPLLPRKRPDHCVATRYTTGHMRKSIISFDHRVGGHEKGLWYREAECLGSLHIDDELKFRRLHDRQVSRRRFTCGPKGDMLWHRSEVGCGGITVG